MRGRFGVVLMAAALAGCSTIPVDETAQAVDDVPPGFLESSTTTVVDTIPEADPPHLLTLYFVNAENRLVRVERARDEPAILQDAIDAVSAPPTETELSEYPGITTTLLAGLQPDAETISDSGVLTVVVTGDELRTSSTQAPERVRLVYSQIVCTAVAFRSDIEAVDIQDAEGSIRVPGGEGSVIEGAVTPADLNDCKTAEELAAEVVDETEDTTVDEGG